MKTPDVTKPVMEKVVRFEKKRTASWFRRFWVAIILSVILVVMLGWFIVNTLSDQQSFALLTLFRQDPEIIASYWQDTIWIFWEEAPHRLVWVALIILLGIVGIIIVTKRKRKILRNKLDKLEKY